MTPAEQAGTEAAWLAGHDALAKLSSHGTNTHIPNAGHYIQIDRPDAVIAAVKRMVETVRAEKR